MAATLIANTRVGAGGTSAITISSIPSTYDDLYVMFSLRSTSVNRDTVLVRFNGDSSTGYRTSRMYHFGSSVVFNRQLSTGVWISTMPGINQQASLFNCGTMYIPMYSNTYPKLIIGEGTSSDNANTNYGNSITAARGSLASPISSITFLSLDTSTIVENSFVSVYGIKKA
jgi:hypothetical protein